MKKVLEHKKSTQPYKITELESEVVMDYLTNEVGTRIKKICIANDDYYENVTVNLSPERLKEVISNSEVIEVECSDGKVIGINSVYIISYELAKMEESKKLNKVI